MKNVHRCHITVHANADTIEIDSDEDGWHLKIVDMDGNKYDFRIHGVAFEFAGSPGLQSLLDWRGEGESIRAEVRQARLASKRVFLSCAAGEHADCTDPDRCECDCHALASSDPKRPGYHDTMSGLADD